MAELEVYDSMIEFLDTFIGTEDLLIESLSSKLQEMALQMKKKWKGKLKMNLPSLRDVLNPLSVSEKISLVKQISIMALKRTSEIFTNFWTLLTTDTIERVKSLSNAIKKEAARILIIILCSHYFKRAEKYFYEAVSHLSENETLKNMTENPEKYMDINL